MTDNGYPAFLGNNNNNNNNNNNRGFEDQSETSGGAMVESTILTLFGSLLDTSIFG